MIGLIKILPFIYRFVSLLIYYGTRTSQDLYKKYGIERSKNFEGSWAIVTGASDGIGLAYCHLLAKQGFNILLISRSEEKLKDVQKQV